MDHDGSGVQSQSATFDGSPATNGHAVDTFLLDAGQHSVVVTAADNLGNTGSVTRTFLVRATAESLLSNSGRVCTEGQIISPGACKRDDGRAERGGGPHARGTTG